MENNDRNILLIIRFVVKHTVVDYNTLLVKIFQKLKKNLKKYTKNYI